MTSRFGQRATGVAAVTAIVLLVILIVLLWTNVGHDFFNENSNSPKKKIHVGSPSSSTHSNVVRNNNIFSGSDFRTTGKVKNDEIFSTMSDLLVPPPEGIHVTGNNQIFSFFFNNFFQF